MSEEGKESIIPDKKADSSSSKTLIKTDGGMEFIVDSRYSLIKCKIPNVLDDLGNGFRVYREIKIMNHCNHPNILSLTNVSIVPNNRDFTDLL